MYKVDPFMSNKMLIDYKTMQKQSINDHNRVLLMKQNKQTLSSL